MNRRLYALLLFFGIIAQFAFPENAQAQSFTWSAGGSRPQDYSMGGDPTEPHGTSFNPGYIRSIVTPISGFGAYAASIAPGQYLGNGIKLSAYVRSDSVTNWAGLWMRVDGPGGTLSFDNMGNRPITGTTVWEQHELILDVPQNSTRIVFGVLLDGTGEVHVDGLQLQLAPRTWDIQNSGFLRSIFAVKAINEQAVWAGAESGAYLRTTDGGTSWVSGTVPGAGPVNFLSIAAIDANTAYFAGASFTGIDTRIYKTTDGGSTWEMQYQNTNPSAFINSIAFWDETHGIAVSDAVGGSFVILRTTNGGTNWNQIPSSNIPPPLPDEYAGFGDGGGTSMALKGTSHAWFGTAYGAVSTDPVRVFRSTDKGLTWSVANTTLSSEGQYHGINTVAFKDTLNGFAGSSTYPYSDSARTLARTTDGGASWSAVSSFPSIHPSTLVYVPHTNNRVLFVTSVQGSAFSDDGGASWQVLNTHRWHIPVSFASPTSGWAAGNAGRIVRFAGNLVTAIAEQRQQGQPEGFRLAQNYPNPFNPSTFIEYQVPAAEHVTLKVFDLLGREVATLVDGVEEPGFKSVTFDAKGIASGVFLYRLQSGKFAETKKLLLLR